MGKVSTWGFFAFFMTGAALMAADEGTFQPQPYDWPQWQGPARNAISQETGLLKSWPKEGPPLAWRAEGLGGGFSAPSVAAGRVFGMSYRGDDEGVWALDEATGKEIWFTRTAAKASRAGYNAGPRCSPTVDGANLYALGVSGDLVCLDVATGKEHWHKSLPKDLGGRMMSGWGYSESPLVDGEKLICTPGGKEATLAALNKTNGEVIWKAQVPQGDGAAYSSVIAADVDGKREYIQFLGGGVVGVSATDGKFLWRYDAPANGVANVSTPVYHDQLVFAASAYGKGGGLMKVPEGKAAKVEQVYLTKSMKNHHGGMILIDGSLYGANGGNGEERIYALVCLNFKTGDVMWQSHEAGKGSLAYADGMLYYHNEDGPMELVEANPKSYMERGRFNQPDRSGEKAWSHPVIANGKLYLRDQNNLFCYDVKQH